MHKRIYKKLLTYFWINLSASIIVFLAIIKIVGIGYIGSGQNVAFEQYSIIISLAGIPLALKLFHSRLKKIEHIEDDNEFLAKYCNSYILRIVIIDAIIILNLAGVYSFGSQNAIYMICIAIIALFFCFPEKKVILSKKENINENIEDNTNNE